MLVSTLAFVSLEACRSVVVQCGRNVLCLWNSTHIRWPVCFSGGQKWLWQPAWLSSEPVSWENMQQVQLRWEPLCFIIPSGASSTNSKRETEIGNLNFSRCLLCYGVCYRYFVRRYNNIRCQKYVSKLYSSSVMLMTAFGKSRRHAFAVAAGFSQEVWRCLGSIYQQHCFVWSSSLGWVDSMKNIASQSKCINSKREIAERCVDR